jgi:hypothetical protein
MYSNVQDWKNIEIHHSVDVCNYERIIYNFKIWLLRSVVFCKIIIVILSNKGAVCIKYEN